MVTESVFNEDLFSSEAIDDPYSYFGYLRDVDPVHWNPDAEIWMVTSHAGVAEVTRNSDRFSSEMMNDPRPAFPRVDSPDPMVDKVVVVEPGLMTVDRPRHTEMRKAVQGFLTPRAVERWREGVRELVEGLLDARAGQSEMEFKEEIAAVVPRTFLFRLLDVPLADLDELFEITMGAHNGSLDPMRMYQIPAARQRIAEYYRPIVEHRSANPGDDLISMLVQGEQQGAFTRDEVYENIELFMLAGFGTTKRLLSNGMIAFCRHPEQWALLHGDPEGMVVSAVEECLRFDPAVKAFYRLAAVDTELGGKSLAAGERLLCVPASANRDPEVFDRPEEFDISRFPNQHVSFGGGVHHCLGAPLARMMAQETLKVLARRISQVRLTDEISYARNYLGHDPVSVPLAWTWA